MSNTTGKGKVLSQHIYVDREKGQMVFRATNGFSDKDEPIGLNCRAQLLEVYVAMAALAYKLRWLQQKRFVPVSARTEPVGVINGKTVAHIINRDGNILVDRVAVSKDEVRVICARFLNSGSGENDSGFLARILAGSVEVVREEDYVELSKAEKDELLAKARRVVEAATPRVEKDMYAYIFTTADLSFAPNFVWGCWALKNARDDDSRWERASFESDYQQGTCSITWRDTEAGEKKAMPKFRQGYCPKGRFAF